MFTLKYPREVNFNFRYFLQKILVKIQGAFVDDEVLPTLDAGEETE